MKASYLENKGCKQWIFTDNFYTRHVLAKKILQFSDQEICMTGTVRFNLVDAINRPALKEAIDTITN